jgi:hypothetical protein
MECLTPECHAAVIPLQPLEHVARAQQHPPQGSACVRCQTLRVRGSGFQPTLGGSTPKLGKVKGLVYDVNNPQRVYTLARFRLGSHSLRIIAGRWQCSVRVPRCERTCLCCATREREDEMHVMQDPAYWDIRHDFADLFVDLPSVHVWHDGDTR